ncbi:MAG: hypothetical protein EP346_01725 [Bacteroidetes bacterium]|uniref:Uncharacterized protein n=1 Tax=Phaeocystidibacter marisrubri TaxID=1577780 RepID=A0A6L3ZJT3_9FLAO|nr:hypothetical protein [Phaeocystidibacter marisrubri]KAB2817899.1 hypothetical protein F8C82_05705 [Phaeocystidibacter marisrubri]TNE31152.1 MAG: hypothetical protein EP346_01725 [Bacteroidota bacterium]
MLLLFAQLAFLGIVLMFLREPNHFIFNFTNLAHWAMPIGVVALDWVSWNTFKQKVGDMTEEQDIIERVNVLQGAYIILWVMVQAGTFLLLTFSIVEENDYFILLAVAQILFYITLRPRLFNFSEQL